MGATLKKDPADQDGSRNIETALSSIDQNDKVPGWIEQEPGAFLHQLFDAWHQNGGFRAGRYYRNSIRRMQEEWLVGDKEIKSLHPKLSGKIKINKREASILIDLFLYRWRFVEDQTDDLELTPDGYMSFAAADREHLRNRIIDAMFQVGKVEERDAIGIDERQKKSPQSEDLFNAIKLFAEEQYPAARAIMTLSRHRTVLGPSPTDTTKFFWYLLDQYYKEDKKRDKFDSMIIWIADVGSRRFEDDDAFDNYLNVASILVNLFTIANFDSVEDEGIKGSLSLLQKMKTISGRERSLRWKWLSQKAIFVLQNLRKDERQYIQESDARDFSDITVTHVGITGEHILPKQIPDRWSSKVRSFYGRSTSNLDDATISVTVKRILTTESGEHGNVEYMAHTKMTPDPEGGEDETLVKSIDLSSPGELYDYAMMLICLAARHRLTSDSSKDSGEGALAITYLRELGFEVLRLQDVFQILQNNANWDYSANLTA